ncbi:MAG: hypothetical protein M3P93_03070, partial [Actinomycetota bacterium]|nr:hypothetical protein [Actinomycetota bacterium]
MALAQLGQQEGPDLPDLRSRPARGLGRRDHLAVGGRGERERPQLAALGEQSGRVVDRDGVPAVQLVGDGLRSHAATS